MAYGGRIYQENKNEWKVATERFFVRDAKDLVPEHQGGDDSKSTKQYQVSRHHPRFAKSGAFG